MWMKKHSMKATTHGNSLAPSHHVVTWFIFAFMTLLFPTTSLIVRASQNHPLLMNFFEIVIIPFAARRERFRIGRVIRRDNVVMSRIGCMNLHLRPETAIPGRGITQPSHCLFWCILFYIQWGASVYRLGWVDFDLSCSTLCLVLLGLMGNWQKWLSRLARWWNIPHQIQPNPVANLTLPSVQYYVTKWK